MAKAGLWRAKEMRAPQWRRGIFSQEAVEVVLSLMPSTNRWPAGSGSRCFSDLAGLGVLVVAKAGLRAGLRAAEEEEAAEAAAEVGVEVLPLVPPLSLSSDSPLLKPPLTRSRPRNPSAAAPSPLYNPG